MCNARGAVAVLTNPGLIARNKNPFPRNSLAYLTLTILSAAFDDEYGASNSNSDTNVESASPNPLLRVITFLTSPFCKSEIKALMVWMTPITLAWNYVMSTS